MRALEGGMLPSGMPTGDGRGLFIRFLHSEQLRNSVSNQWPLNLKDRNSEKTSVNGPFALSHGTAVPGKTFLEFSSHFPDIQLLSNGELAETFLSNRANVVKLASNTSPGRRTFREAAWEI